MNPTAVPIQGGVPENQLPENSVDYASAIDLCCGMGGLSVAAKSLRLRVLAGVDLSASALRTYGKNFPGSQAILGSICERETLDKCSALARTVQESNGHLLVVSGPPCQGFSMAGRRDPKDPRNQVLLSVAKAIAEMQPSCALIENVPLLLGSKYQEHTDSLEEILRAGGYHCLRVVLNASDFGVPQKRKRAFFLVTRQVLDEMSIIATLTNLQKQAGTVSDVLRGLPSPLPRPLDYSDEGAYEGVQNHFAMRHSAAVKAKIAQITPGKGPMSYRRLHPDKLSNTLFSGHRAPPAHYEEARSITVREAARLQGFPDTFRVYGSFGNQMEQVTNAVPPPLAQAALKVLLQHAGLRVDVDG